MPSSRSAVNESARALWIVTIKDNRPIFLPEIHLPLFAEPNNVRTACATFIFSAVPGHGSEPNHPRNQLSEPLSPNLARQDPPCRGKA